MNVKCYFTFETSSRIDSKNLSIITLCWVDGWDRESMFIYDVCFHWTPVHVNNRSKDVIFMQNIHIAWLIRNNKLKNILIRFLISKTTFHIAWWNCNALLIYIKLSQEPPLRWVWHLIPSWRWNIFYFVILT